MTAHLVPGNESLRTFLRFVCVGGSATALQYLLLVVLVVETGWTPVIASSLAYAISTVFNYALSRSFTFRSHRAHASALPRFVLVSVIGIGINALVVWLSFNQLGLHYLLAQALATVMTLGWNYTAARNWAFAY